MSVLTPEVCERFYPVDPELVAAVNEAMSGWVDSETEALLNSTVTLVGPVEEVASPHIVESKNDNPAEGMTLLWDLDPDITARIKRQVQEMKLGRFVTKNTVPSAEARKYTSAYDMLTAPEDDEFARAGAIYNIKTILQEGVKPHTNAIVVETTLEDGDITQFGQSITDIAANALRLEGDDVSVAESVTMLSTRELIKAGNIRPGDSWLEASRMPDGQREYLRSRGYFVASVTAVIRKSTLMADGKTIKTVSHFWAGSDIVGIEERLGSDMDQDVMAAREELALAQRYDKELINRLFTEVFGMPPVEDESAAGFLERSVIVKAGEMPDIDLVALKALDRFAEEKMGAESVFYGVRQPKQNYEEFVENCIREAEALDVAAESLYKEARQYVLTHNVSRDDVPAILAELSRAYIAKEVIEGRARPDVLGKGAALAVKTMRAMAAGDYMMAQQLFIKTIANTQTVGCPVRVKKTRDSADMGGDTMNEMRSELGLASPDEEDAVEGGACRELKNGELVRCPECKKEVRLIVDEKNKDKLYCSNRSCKLAGSDAQITNIEEAFGGAQKKREAAAAKFTLFQGSGRAKRTGVLATSGMSR